MGAYRYLLSTLATNHPPSSPPRAHHRIRTVTSHIGGPHHQCVVPLSTSSWGCLGEENRLATSQIALQHRAMEDMPRTHSIPRSRTAQIALLLGQWRER